MLARVKSATICGVDAVPVEVEVDFAAQGLPAFRTVGLPDATLRESRERIKAALRNIDMSIATRLVTVNLAPAELPKGGSSFELAIALGAAIADEKLERGCLDGYLVVGELGLDARTRPLRGAIAYALLARELGLSLLISGASAAEAAIVKGLVVYGVQSLVDVLAMLKGTLSLLPARPVPAPSEPGFDGCDLGDVKGQSAAKRALEIVAGGGHNLLMVGPPGSGKTMLARRLPGLLPPLSEEESFEVTRVHSVAGLLAPDAGLVHRRPFRAPHHTISYAGLVGGYKPLRPGEASLASRGVLFLDELAEFSRRSLEALREPMEEGSIRLSRYGFRASYPARFVFVGAMNPCPCGYFGDATRPCSCAPAVVERYRSRVSGPLLDRVDVSVSVGRVPVEEFEVRDVQVESASVRARVVAARAVQAKRYAGSGVALNADVGDAPIWRVAAPDLKARSLLARAVERFGLSPRGYVRVLRVARTIADLEGRETCGFEHIAEALHYRLPEGSPA